MSPTERLIWVGTPGSTRIQRYFTVSTFHRSTFRHTASSLENYSYTLIRRRGGYLLVHLDFETVTIRLENRRQPSTLTLCMPSARKTSKSSCSDLSLPAGNSGPDVFPMSSGVGECTSNLETPCNASRSSFISRIVYGVLGFPLAQAPELTQSPAQLHLLQRRISEHSVIPFLERAIQARSRNVSGSVRFEVPDLTA